MSDIAEAAGVSTRSVARYFPTLEELVIATARLSIAEQSALCREYMIKLVEDHCTGRNLLDALLTLMKQAFFHHPEMFVFLADIELLLGSCGYCNECLENYEHNYLFIVQCIEEALARGREDHSIRFSGDINQEARFICQSYIGILTQAALLNRTSYDTVTKEFCERSLSYYIQRIMDNLS